MKQSVWMERSKVFKKKKKAVGFIYKPPPLFSQLLSGISGICVRFISLAHKDNIRPFLFADEFRVLYSLSVHLRSTIRQCDRKVSIGPSFHFSDFAQSRQSNYHRILQLCSYEQQITLSLFWILVNWKKSIDHKVFLNTRSLLEPSEK